MLELAPKVYRAMSPDDDGRPAVGRTARSLGVRVTAPNSQVFDGVDIATHADGTVRPATGGMSVAPRWQDLPPHRIPRRLNTSLETRDACGNNRDVCWTVGSGGFQAGEFGPALVLAVDSPIHGTIQPGRITSLTEYEAALTATRDEWVRGED